MLRPREIFEDLILFPVRTPTLPPATHTNCYALGERDVLLVEPATPYADEGRALLAWVEGLRVAGRKVVAILLTHHHVDHSGGAAFFARELGVPIWAHPLTAERLPELEVSRPLEEGDLLELEGVNASSWRILHTPGHAPGHVCFFDERRKVAIVGDMVASQGTILIEPVDGDMEVYLAQLARLASLDARLALPSHGDPIEAPTATFHRYIAHRLAREESVFAALAARPASRAEDLVPAAYADTPPAIWPLALLSLRAHLVKLERDGRVRLDHGLFTATAESRKD